MRKNFRFSRFEEKKNVRRAVIFIVLTVVLMCALFFYGIPVMARFASFVSEIGKGDDPITREDKIPPAPPRIEDVPEATNKLTVDIKGTTEASATVIIDFNGKTEEILAGVGGEFSKNFNLLKGKNSFSLVARDQAGNVSQSTETYTLEYDNDEPTLEISSPTEGSQFFGSGQRQITIEGKTEPEINLSINDRFVSVSEDGTFSFTTTLNDGANELNIKAEDAAKNLTEKKLTVNFTP